MRQENRVLSMVIFLLILLFFIPFGIGCKEKSQPVQQPQKKAPLVFVEAVAKGEMVRSVDLTADVVPIDTVQISCTVEGPISFCPWREGDSVRKGEKVIEIDREVYRNEVKAAEAALAVARAKLEDMKAGTRPEEIEKARQNVRDAEQSAEFEKTDFERIAKLVESGALKGEDLEKARVRLVSAEAKLNSARKQLEMLEAGFTPTQIAVQEAVVKEAEARLELARARLQECVIVSPINGTVMKVFVRPGNVASVKTPLIEIADLSTLVLRCAVPEIYASKVRQEMAAQVWLDAIPGKMFMAEVTRIYPEMDRRTRTLTIELSIKEQVALSPGMFGRVRLILESIKDAINVPLQSIVITPSGSSVAFVVVDGKAVQRKVKTGIEDGKRIQILDGLEPGEKVVVSGQEKLKDGVEVRVAEPGKGAGKPTSSGGAAGFPTDSSGKGAVRYEDYGLCG